MQPLCLSFCRPLVVQSAVRSQLIVIYVDEVPKLVSSFVNGLIVARIYFLLLDGTDQPLKLAVFARLAFGGHADLRALVAQQFDIGFGGVLPALV